MKLCVNLACSPIGPMDAQDRALLDAEDRIRPGADDWRSDRLLGSEHNQWIFSVEMDYAFLGIEVAINP